MNKEYETRIHFDLQPGEDFTSKRIIETHYGKSVSKSTGVIPMNFDLNKAIELIKDNKDFLKLKTIVENNSGHDNEVEYDHCVKTYEIAKEAVKGEFITNNDAKQKFEDFLNKDIDGIKKRDILQIGALIHDIGKLIVLEKNGKQKPLGNINADGTFGLFPQHGYWGSLIVKNVMKIIK